MAIFINEVDLRPGVGYGRHVKYWPAKVVIIEPSESYVGKHRKDAGEAGWAEWDANNH